MSEHRPQEVKRRGRVGQDGDGKGCRAPNTDNGSTSPTHIKSYYFTDVFFFLGRNPGGVGEELRECRRWFVRNCYFVSSLPSPFLP